MSVNEMNEVSAHAALGRPPGPACRGGRQALATPSCCGLDLMSPRTRSVPARRVRK